MKAALKKTTADGFVEILKPPVKLLDLKHPSDHFLDEPKSLSHEHTLQLARGVYLMEEYWQQQHIVISYRLTDYNQYYLSGLKELEFYTRQFHKTIAPWQQIDNKILVFGVGATQILHAAMYALSIEHARASSHKGYLAAAPLYFTHQLPGYLGSKETIETFGGFNTRWIDFAKAHKIPPENLVEIVTSPNNPDAKLLTSQTNAKYLINDRVNLWPFYMTHTPEAFAQETLANDSISVFSLAKLLSFSGSRVGYALVNDPAIAHSMRHFIISSTHGIAVDGQVRFLTALRFLVQNHKVNEYINWVNREFKRRWHLLEELLQHTDIKLLNHAGPNIWVRTPEPAEEYLERKYHIKSTYGPEYGVDDTHARLNMSCTHKEFEEFMWRLQHPCE